MGFRGRLAGGTGPDNVPDGQIAVAGRANEPVELHLSSRLWNRGERVERPSRSFPIGSSERTATYEPPNPLEKSECPIQHSRRGFRLL
jgi:hypothetical protein